MDHEPTIKLDDELLPPTAFSVDFLQKEFTLKNVEESKDPAAIRHQSLEFVKEFARLMIQDEKWYEHMKSQHEDFLQGALLLAQKCALIIDD